MRAEHQAIEQQRDAKMKNVLDEKQYADYLQTKADLQKRMKAKARMRRSQMKDQPMD